ncbi:MAG: hypothetical protein IKW97_07745 [Muribaculaceae bacterium]|nr:hypothetical protein [Muribaculaceae bacterium]
MKKNTGFHGEFLTWLKKYRNFDENSTSAQDYAKILDSDFFSDLMKEIENHNNSNKIKMPEITWSESNFFSIIPKMVKVYLNLDKNSQKEKKTRMKKEILNLINLASRSVTISKVYFTTDVDKKAFDKRAYFNRYVEFIKQALNEGTNILKIINPALNAIGNLEDKEYSKIKQDLNHYKVYDYDSLRTKFRARLRTQDRNSGEKIWLPLTFISKIYTGLNQCDSPEKKEHKDDFTKWLEEIIRSIYIYYYDKNNAIKVLSFNRKNVAFLEFEQAKQVWLIKKDGNRHLVATPTNTGNQKAKMTATDINRIDIDHVKPIDLTLKELGDPQNNQLKQLEIISNEFRLLSEKDDSKEEQERTIEALIKNLNFVDLKDELEKIRLDSPYRLMDSTKNSEKNNSLTFNEIYKRWGKDSHYYGFIDFAWMNLENNAVKVVIYQDLSENGITRIMKENEFKELTNYRIIKISKVPKELI